jgi:very-short-patch-repair endonuclease
MARFKGTVMPARIPDTDSKIEEIIEDAKRSALESLEHDFSWSLGRCESPIEKLFAAQLIHPDTAGEYDMKIDLLNPPSGQVEHCKPYPKEGVSLWQQIQIGTYRVDFLLGSYPDRGLAPLIVECDGHDFHERTKEQAQRDKSRDRYLVARGYRILRFTGSEIYRDPHECAHEALQVLLGIAG